MATYNLPNTISNGDAPDATKLMGNFDYVENTLNDFDGANITAGTITDDKLTNDPTSIRDETIQDHVVSGLTSSDPGASLTGVIAAGVAYIEGVRVAVNSFSHAYTASKDCYVDLDKNGEFHVTEVANGAAEPAIYANSIRLAKFVTNGTEITSYVDKRVMFMDDFTSYTPVWTLAGGSSSVGNATQTGGYKQTGKIIDFWAKFVIGGTTNFSGLTSVAVSLPRTAGTVFDEAIEGGHISGVAKCNGSYYPLSTIPNSASQLKLLIIPASGAYSVFADVAAAAPGAWGANDTMFISGRYSI